MKFLGRRRSKVWVFCAKQQKQMNLREVNSVELSATSVELQKAQPVRE